MNSVVCAVWLLCLGFTGAQEDKQLLLILPEQALQNINLAGLLSRISGVAGPRTFTFSTGSSDSQNSAAHIQQLLPNIPNIYPQIQHSAPNDPYASQLSSFVSNGRVGSQRSPIIDVGSHPTIVGSPGEPDNSPLKANRYDAVSRQPEGPQAEAILLIPAGDLGHLGALTGIPGLQRRKVPQRIYAPSPSQLYSVPVQPSAPLENSAQYEASYTSLPAVRAVSPEEYSNFADSLNSATVTKQVVEERRSVILPIPHPSQGFGAAPSLANSAPQVSYSGGQLAAPPGDDILPQGDYQPTDDVNYGPPAPPDPSLPTPNINYAPQYKSAAFGEQGQTIKGEPLTEPTIRFPSSEESEPIESAEQIRLPSPPTPATTTPVPQPQPVVIPQVSNSAPLEEPIPQAPAPALVSHQGSVPIHAPAPVARPVVPAVVAPVVINRPSPVSSDVIRSLPPAPVAVAPSFTARVPPPAPVVLADPVVSIRPPAPVKRHPAPIVTSSAPISAPPAPVATLIRQQSQNKAPAPPPPPPSALIRTPAAPVAPVRESQRGRAPQQAIPVPLDKNASPPSSQDLEPRPPAPIVLKQAPAPPPTSAISPPAPIRSQSVPSALSLVAPQGRQIVGRSEAGNLVKLVPNARRGAQGPAPPGFVGSNESLEDNHRWCCFWAKRGQCSNNSDWMLTNCQKACSGQGCAGCIDEDVSCSEWAKEGQCLKNSSYMKFICRKSCGQCSHR